LQTYGDDRLKNSINKSINTSVHEREPVSSPLLFVIVMEMTSRQLRAGLPLELLYGDDLIFMAESEENT